jgi:hypothetical protein
MNRVVKHNLKIMTGLRDGDLQSIISNESHGGNAGTQKGKPCVGANFFFKVSTGHILLFSNRIQHKPDIDKGTLRLALDYAKVPSTKIGRWLLKNLTRKYPEIIDVFLPKNTPKKSKLNIELSIKLYNQLK